MRGHALRLAQLLFATWGVFWEVLVVFKKLFCTFVIAGALPMLAQTSSPSNNQQGQNGGGRRGNFSPCWQQAGIEKSVMEQRWAAERETRSQVEAVCANSSLTAQQKQQQAREIRQQSRQKMEGLITPAQEKALTACQQERGMNHGGGGPQAGAQQEGGGCGEWSHGGQGGQGWQRPGGSQNGGAGNRNGGTNTAPLTNAPPNSSPQN
jgi:hypothetical protein